MNGRLGPTATLFARRLRLSRRAGVVLILLLITVGQSMGSGNAPVAVAATTSAPPNTVRVVTVPSRIDATGATDVSAALNAFLRRVPDRSTIVFKARGIYKLGSAIHITDRHNLEFKGNGATLRMAGCDVEDSAFLLDGTPSTRIAIRNFRMIGDNRKAGTKSAFVGGCESSMGVAIYGARDIIVSNVTISSVHGECLYIDAGGNPRGTTPWAERITFRDSTCRLNGRMGVAFIAVRHVVVTRNTFDDIAISVFDIEPTRPDGGATFITLTDNVIKDYGASPRWTPWVLEGSAYGMTTTIVHDVTLARNRITGMTRSEHTGASGGLRVKAMTERWARFSIRDNVSTVSGTGPTMYFRYVDGLRVTGNVQPLTRGPLVWFDDTSG
jgi:uncharacterized protein YifN (PemK superfamily)